MRVHAMKVAVAVTFAVVVPHMAAAQSYPTKPIRVVTADPGGAGDLTARLISQGMGSGLGQQLVVENRGGAGGVIAGDTVAKASPDGYTLLVHGSAIWLAPLLRDKVPYDPLKDLLPISLAVDAPNVIVVHPSVGAKSVKELISIAKSKPGTLNYGTGSIGSGAHLAAELFNAMSGAGIVRVSYKGSGAAVNDLVGGRIQVMFSAPASVLPHIKSGKLLALGVTTSQPSPSLPDVPTVAASGLSGYEASSYFGFLAPAGTPPAIINRLNGEVVKVVNQPDIKAKFLASGINTVGSSPEDFGRKIQAEVIRMGKVIKDANIRDDS